MLRIGADNEAMGRSYGAGQTVCPVGNCANGFAISLTGRNTPFFITHSTLARSSLFRSGGPDEF